MYPTIDAHLEHCRARGFSTDTTIPDRREVLERIIRDLGDLHTATPDQYAAWLAHDGWSPQTRATYYAHANGYLRWAVRRGLIPTNPLDDLDRPRVPSNAQRGIDDATFAQVLGDPAEPWLTASKLGGYAGLRCFEIARAQREDITEDTIQVHGKGGRVDQIPTSPAIWSHVRTMPPGLLVRSGRGQWGAKALSGCYSARQRERGRVVALHDLRRHFADSLRRAGVDMEVIRTLMRHTSLTTTQRYFSAREEERQAAIRALPLVA